MAMHDSYIGSIRDQVFKLQAARIAARDAEKELLKYRQQLRLVGKFLVDNLMVEFAEAGAIQITEYPMMQPPARENLNER